MLQWNFLERIRAEKQREWSQSGPTRHILIDNFLEPGTADALYNIKGVERKLTKPMARTHKHVRGKSGTPRPAEMTELQAQFFQEINSPQFVAYLEDITGIKPLYADDALNGGGVHLTRPGGYLNVHLDFNGHPSEPTQRRLNLLLYLNKEWKDEWNGHIELWDTGIQRPFLKAAPLINRVLIFETSEESFHGHPAPLKTPRGTYRFSLACYYYADWPPGLERRPQTYYQLTRHQWAILFTRIAEQNAKGVSDLETITNNIEVDFQRGDIKVAHEALSRLEKQKPLGSASWAQMMDRMADALYQKPTTAEEMVAEVGSAFDPASVRLGYEALVKLRSAKLTGERYWEYPDGTCSMNGPETAAAE